MVRKYEELHPIERGAALTELASEDWERISVALVRLSLHDPDQDWLEACLFPYLAHDHHWVRGVAAMCFGHVARLHGGLRNKQVVPAIRGLLHDEDMGTRGKADDALDDIKIFSSRR